MLNERKKLLGKIHIVKKELGLDEDTYRSIISEATGKNSAALCTDLQLKKTIELMQRKGRSKNRPIKLPSFIRKIYALWGELQKSGKVKSHNEAGLNSFIAKYSAKSRVKDLTKTEAQPIIEILKKIIERP